jgi:hypothetical protein
MRAGFKRREFVAGIVVILVVVLLATCHRAPKAPGAVTITFVGYTNAPNDNARLALFAVTNLTGHDMRWWAGCVEFETDPYGKARIVNPVLPGLNMSLALRPGGSLAFGVRDPVRAPQSGRWRYSVSFTRYSLGLRWLDFAARYKLPFKLGPITLVDHQLMLDATNQVVVSSDWLTH